jgi:large subunit ribosomal protein L1
MEVYDTTFEVEIKNDKLGNVHLSIGKVSFSVENLKTNLEEVIAVITRAKPASSKGEYIKSVFMSSTMGPSVSVDINL